MEKELPERDDWFDGLAEFATVALYRKKQTLK
jgi:hypothetical protein